MTVTEGNTPWVLSFCDIPEPLLEHIFQHHLSLTDLACAFGVSKTFRAWCEAGLRCRQAITLADFGLYARLHNYLLLGDGGRPGLREAILRYLPTAFHYISKHCRSLKALHLDLPAPPMPISVAAGRAAAAEDFPPAGPHQQECPPVDGFLVKLVAQGCPQLRSIKLINVTNNRAINRLIHVNDAFLAVLAKSSGNNLTELCIGHRGGEDCIYNLAASFYCEGVTDRGIGAIARGCTNLRSLGLLRCNKVGDTGLGEVAHYCRRLEALTLHHCPEVSDAALVEVAESCRALQALDVTVARRVTGLLMGEEAEQLGFRALFTLAANCPLLEELVISEASLDAPAVDDDALACIAHGCRHLRRLELRHCSGVTDAGLRAVANRCKELQELCLEHTGVGDASIEAIARGCPRLRRLHMTNYSATALSRLVLPAAAAAGGAEGGGAGAASARGVSDAALRHVADHCHMLEDLSVTGSRLITDAGVQYLADPRHAALHCRLRALALNHTAATESAVCALLARCGGLRSLGVRGLLYNMLSTMECIAANCRQLKVVDLRHCSTLSDAGLAALAQCPFLEELYASFCSRLTDEGVEALAAAAGRRLRRLELYHVPQLGAGGVAALEEHCEVLEQVNLGRCGAIGGLAGQGGGRGGSGRREGLGGRGCLVLASHYLDL